MYGAILGDMIGAPYEFDRGRKTKDFPLFSEGSQFTDDTVMTIAVAEALLDTMGQPDKLIKAELVRSMQRWGRKYPHAGYGGRFRHWLTAQNPKPYSSYGNGSAMRVSAAGWLYTTIEDTRHAARLTAEVTHNHPEGIKGAEATASAIFLARTGSSKDKIQAYIRHEFGYDLSRTCDEIRPKYHHVESCQETVPEAITAFLEGTDFEDVIRTAVSLGGDCDTLTCIAGGIAEAFYGVPVLYEAECKARLPEDMLEVLTRFDAARGRVQKSDDGLSGNFVIEDAIQNFHEKSSRENLAAVLDSIHARMHEEGRLLIPIILTQRFFDTLDLGSTKIGDTVTVEQEQRFKLHHIETTDGKQWLVAFTSEKERDKGESTSSMSYCIADMLRDCRNMNESGVIINPWGRNFLLTKELINAILDSDRGCCATPERG
jgi:ADP-ribosylglycohydrolase